MRKGTLFPVSRKDQFHTVYGIFCLNRHVADLARASTPRKKLAIGLAGGSEAWYNAFTTR